MKQLKLLFLQVLVAVIGLAIWHVLTVYPVIGDPKKIQFFFSTPFEVLARTWKLFASGEIWYHLGITLTETILAFVFGAGGGILFGFMFARNALMAAVFDPCPASCWPRFSRSGSDLASGRK
jgi:NitT/TauT family transport system permease protein